MVDGRPVGSIAIYHDITDVNRQRRFFETLLEVSPEAIVTTGIDDIVASWNPAAERLFGYTAEEAIGRNVNELVADRDQLRGGIELGADDYLAKPVDPTLLGARIRAGLMKKRLRDLEMEHLTEVARLNAQLEARVEEQMGELVRTGELKRFLPAQVSEALLAGHLSATDGVERRKLTLLFADMVGVHRPVGLARARGALRRAERVPARDGDRRRRVPGDAE